ncbi:hypothetical protein KIK06_29135 [Nocardiopsis sp. EMB25]|uniref:hypothetical protein n=1 Tax=Nocardiopsis sp. EMB25 TaxID=2835867 RepID=UPI0022843600|nr:hypothetical protein [Nocardiopsis sp. EMB25]MCY9787949.1 hypothetical protein [Nocardiopsis sp. EMB25]
MSWLHRDCTTQIRALEDELREAQNRAIDHTLVVTDLTSARDRADAERWDAKGEAELLREKLSDAADREADLRAEIHELQCRVNDLEEADTARRAVLEARRRRAAEHALGGAWRAPSHDTSNGRAQLAQALMALPLESFDVEVTYVYASGFGEGDWRVDGRPVNTNTGFAYTSEVDVLIGRYGVTHEELDSIYRQAKRARRTAA